MAAALAALSPGTPLSLRMAGRPATLMVRASKLPDVAARAPSSSNADENAASLDVDSFILTRWSNSKGRVLGLAVEVYVTSHTQKDAPPYTSTAIASRPLNDRPWHGQSYLFEISFVLPTLLVELEVSLHV